MSDFATIKDRLTDLIATMGFADSPADHLIVSTCSNRVGQDVVRFDVMRLDDDEVQRLYRTEIRIDTYRHAEPLIVDGTSSDFGGTRVD